MRSLQFARRSFGRLPHGYTVSSVIAFGDAAEHRQRHYCVGDDAGGHAILPQGIPTQIEPLHLAVLAVSGVIGIAIGDSAYFAALKRIGPNKTLLLESLAPPLSGVLALVFLGSGADITKLAWRGGDNRSGDFVVFQPSSSGEETNWSGIDLACWRVYAKPQVW